MATDVLTLTLDRSPDNFQQGMYHYLYHFQPGFVLFPINFRLFKLLEVSLLFSGNVLLPPLGLMHIRQSNNSSILDLTRIFALLGIIRYFFCSTLFLLCSPSLQVCFVSWKQNLATKAHFSRLHIRQTETSRSRWTLHHHDLTRRILRSVRSTQADIRTLQDTFPDSRIPETSPQPCLWTTGSEMLSTGVRNEVLFCWLVRHFWRKVLDLRLPLPLERPLDQRNSLFVNIVIDSSPSRIIFWFMNGRTLMNARIAVTFATRHSGGKTICEITGTSTARRNPSNAVNVEKGSANLEP